MTSAYALLVATLIRLEGVNLLAGLLLRLARTD